MRYRLKALCFFVHKILKRDNKKNVMGEPLREQNVK